MPLSTRIPLELHVRKQIFSLLQQEHLVTHQLRRLIAGPSSTYLDQGLLESERLEQMNKIYSEHPRLVENFLLSFPLRAYRPTPINNPKNKQRFLLTLLGCVLKSQRGQQNDELINLGLWASRFDDALPFISLLKNEVVKAHHLASYYHRHKRLPPTLARHIKDPESQQWLYDLLLHHCGSMYADASAFLNNRFLSIESRTNFFIDCSGDEMDICTLLNLKFVLLIDSQFMLEDRLIPYLLNLVQQAEKTTTLDLEKDKLTHLMITKCHLQPPTALRLYQWDPQILDHPTPEALKLLQALNHTKEYQSYLLKQNLQFINMAPTKENWPLYQKLITEVFNTQKQTAINAII